MNIYRCPWKMNPQLSWFRGSSSAEQYGFAPETRVTGPTIGALLYSSSAQIVALLTCRVLEFPRVISHDDFGMAAQLGSVDVASEACKDLNRILQILLKAQILNSSE